MKKFWLAFLVFLLWAVFALLFHQYVSNSICGECATAHNLKDGHSTNKEEIVTSNSTPKAAFSIIAADGSSIFKFPKKFTLNSTNGTINIPDELAGFKDSIYNYLNVNPGKELLLSVKHLASEVDDAKGIHLGNSRIEFLKNILVKAGVNPDRIIPKTVLSEFSYDENGNYFDGISMLFQNISEERISEIEAGISNKTLYADFAQAEFKPDRTLTAYTLELKNYLQKYPDKKVIVTGHTDSVGVNNYQWGLDRANNVKNYLISQGVSTDIVEVVSKGETEPVASNKTEEGRAKNRRIVITIK